MLYVWQTLLGKINKSLARINKCQVIKMEIPILSWGMCMWSQCLKKFIHTLKTSIIFHVRYTELPVFNWLPVVAKVTAFDFAKSMLGKTLISLIKTTSSWVSCFLSYYICYKIFRNLFLTTGESGTKTNMRPLLLSGWRRRRERL